MNDVLRFRRSRFIDMFCNAAGPPSRSRDPCVPRCAPCLSHKASARRNDLIRHQSQRTRVDCIRSVSGPASALIGQSGVRRPGTILGAPGDHRQKEMKTCISKSSKHSNQMVLQDVQMQKQTSPQQQQQQNQPLAGLSLSLNENCSVSISTSAQTPDVPIKNVLQIQCAFVIIANSARGKS